jgi:glycosyltransferase involved in cell wall biosynthesis
VSVFTRAVDMLKYEGLPSTAWRGAKWLSSRTNPFAEKPLSVVFPQDVLAVDWTNPRTFAPEPLISESGRPQIAWVISPPNASSGGHQNAYMFMKFLEDAGYDLTLFLYSAGKYPRVSIEGIRDMLELNGGYPRLRADYKLYNPETGITGDFDLVVATDWATAYAAWRYERDVPRIYWVLDFEPDFFPAGSDSIIAENSYRLGYQGIAIGPWLAKKLAHDYSMPCDFYEYAVDASRYRRTNDNRRDEILFYARPSTPRRGTEFGLLVLSEVARRRPDITINMAGSDMSRQGIKFDFVDHGSLDVRELPYLYNRCAAGLVLSLTCMSLLPLEIMSCGVVPVVNDGENTRVTLRNDSRIEFVATSPSAMADRLISAVDRADQQEHSRYLASSSSGGSWSAAGEKVVSIFNKTIDRT